MRTCMKCMAENDEHEVVCRKCGSGELVVQKESLVRCPHCGEDLKEGDRECYSCGHTV